MPFKFQLCVDLNTTMNYMHKHQDSRCIQELVSKTDDTICIKIPSNGVSTQVKAGRSRWWCGLKPWKLFIVEIEESLIHWRGCCFSDMIFFKRSVLCFALSVLVVSSFRQYDRSSDIFWALDLKHFAISSFVLMQRCRKWILILQKKKVCGNYLSVPYGYSLFW